MRSEYIANALAEFIAAVRHIFAAEAASNPDAAPQLRRVLEYMQELQPDPEAPEPHELPGCRHLPRALDLGEASSVAAVAAVLRKLLPTLAWAQNPRYNAENKGADFMDNYGWSALGLAGNSNMAFGVMLLGPGVTYPLTSYESEGAFLVIGGSPEWISDDGDWRRVEAGDVICRPWGGAEGKRPGDEPMLALYAWMYTPT
jgi:Dimethlysulfonioproprionate lyase